MPKTPVNNQPFDLPTSLCGFGIHVGVVRDNELQTDTTLPDGTIVEKIKGKLILSFTNTGVGGKSIVKDVSGSTTETVHPDKTHLFVGTGRNWLGFGPVGRANTGEPGLVFTSGKVTVTSVLNAAGGLTAQTFTLDGRQVNGCDLLR